MNFGLSFPAMNTPDDMIEPLAYLASEDEMIALSVQVLNLNLHLMNFWIKCGGNIEKARELIRIYYTRALYANYYFSSYREGWRTDRGMIYIIYGPPDKVYKSQLRMNRGDIAKPKSNLPGEQGIRLKRIICSLIFKKRDNRFSDNDYSLNRSETVVSYLG